MTHPCSFDGLRIIPEELLFVTYGFIRYIYCENILLWWHIHCKFSPDYIEVKSTDNLLKR